jgi:uncharacterized iron-regulated protein
MLDRTRDIPAQSAGGFRTPLLLALLMVVLAATASGAHTLRLADKQEITLAEMVADLRRAQVVLLGETHDNPRHHQAQLQLVKALVEAGAKVTLGLEMFRADSQPALDQWVAGRLNLADFRRIARDNWGNSELYEQIYLFARERRIPLRGLNIPRRISRQVLAQGFASLPKEMLAELPEVQCVVTPAYRRFIGRALNKHQRSGLDFSNFCEAQLLWDTVMAKNLHDYLVKNPDRLLVVLTGSGHAWKHAIPAQLDRLGASDWRVVLPEVPGASERRWLSADDADYLLLGIDRSPLH